jgi:glycosyltransferase involved in cell wall biosynthesis
VDVSGVLNRDPAVVFVCPFDLSRYRGTALRARITKDALCTRLPCGLICRGGGGEGSILLDADWQGGAGLAAFLRPLRFALSATPHIARLAPRAMHTFDVLSSLPAILRWKPKLGLRVVVELHSLHSAEMGRGGPAARSAIRALERFVLRRADRIIAMSYSQQTYLTQAFGIPADKIRVIWGPVDLDIFQYREPGKAEVVRAAYSGNDFHWQGVDDCLDAARLLAAESNIEFLFVTGSGWRTDLTGRDRVARIEAETREQTAQQLTRCDVLLSPRKGRAADVQYPFKLSSYLALGRPVVATDVSDQRRILEAAQCGIVIPPGSPRAIAEAIRRLRDEGRADRVAMGERARLFAEEHLSMDKFRSSVLAMYEELGISA